MNKDVLENLNEGLLENATKALEIVKNKNIEDKSWFENFCDELDKLIPSQKNTFDYDEIFEIVLIKAGLI